MVNFIVNVAEARAEIDNSESKIMLLSAHADVFSLFSPMTSTTSGAHIYDYIGAATRVTYKRGWATHALAAGKSVTPSAPPKNEHYLDWVAILQAVDRAKGLFRMAELGAGWAAWTVRAALATRQRPAVNALELLAVEADPQHYAWSLEHFRDNGLDPSRYHLLHGAASARSEKVRFPVVSDPDVNYGASLSGAVAAMDTIEVQGYTLPELLERFSGPLDLLHVDIQGAEYDCLPPAMNRLSRSVKCIMIGTHISDAGHNGLAEAFRAAGWREELNLPRNRKSLTPWGEIELNDGFLLFNNPALLSA